MKKPVIGILCGVSELDYKERKITQFYTFNDYNTAVLKHNGIPILITPPKEIDYAKTKKEDITPLTDEEKSVLIDALSICDGFIMPGGSKTFEHNYFIDSYLKEHNIPTLGICLGMQVMAINETKQKPVRLANDNHFRTNHDVKITGKILKNILNKELINVNSYHFYNMLDVGSYTISALSPDGVIEAIEDDNSLFRLGVQWHPERDIENENSKKIFEAFINAAIEYKNKK